MATSSSWHRRSERYLPPGDISHRIQEDLAVAVSEPKQQGGQDILVAGSNTLVQTLLQHNLVDEVRLLVHPMVLGSGKKLFQDGTLKQTLTLTETKTFRTSIVALSYQPTING